MKGNSELNACKGGRQKLEHPRGLFTIEVEIGMIELYLEMLMVGVQSEVFSGKPPR